MIIKINKSDVSRFYSPTLGTHMCLIDIGGVSNDINLCFVLSDYNMPKEYIKPFSFREMGESYLIKNFYEPNPHLMLSYWDTKIIFKLFLSSEFSKKEKTSSVFHVLFKDVEINSDNGLYCDDDPITQRSFFTQDNIYLLKCNSHLPPDNIINSVNNAIGRFNEIVSDSNKFSEIINIFKISEATINNAIKEGNLCIRVGSDPTTYTRREARP